MHPFNAAHWMCVLIGALLVVTGFISRLSGSNQPAPSASALGQVLPARRVGATGPALKRATLVLVGMVGVAYGAYWLIH